jgi:hypothetical protein
MFQLRRLGYPWAVRQVSGTVSSHVNPWVYTNDNAHDESPVSGDSARCYGVVEDDFCVSEFEAIWCVRTEGVSPLHDARTVVVRKRYLHKAHSTAQSQINQRTERR